MDDSDGEDGFQHVGMEEEDEDEHNHDEIPDGFIEEEGENEDDHKERAGEEQMSADQYISQMEQLVIKETQKKNGGGGGPIQIRTSIPDDDDEYIPPVWKNIVPYHKDMQMVHEAKEEYCPDPHWCYLCEFGQMENDIENNEFHVACIRLLEEQMHLCSVMRYTTAVQTFFNLFVRPCCELKNSNPLYMPLVWRRITIHEHYQNHVMKTSVVAYEMARIYWDATRIIRDNGLVQEEQRTKQKRIDPIQLKLLDTTAKSMHTWLSRTDQTRTFSGV